MQITCLHAVRRLTKAGRAPDERGLIPEPNKTVPDPVHGSSLDHIWTKPRGQGGRPTAIHYHGYRQLTPQALTATAAPAITDSITWLPLNVAIVDSNRGAIPSSYRARALGAGVQEVSRGTASSHAGWQPLPGTCC